MLERFAWLGVGGNVGNTAEIFRQARRSLQTLSKEPIIVSPIYQSEPWGLHEQAPFLNQVVGLVPRQPPDSLFEELLRIETYHGRNRAEEVRWGPRRLDLDILAWPDKKGVFKRVILPHPRMHQRRFVLQPFADIAPSLKPFGYDKKVEELLRECSDTGQLLQTS